MPSLTSEEMDELSCKITEYAMVFLFQEWVKEAVPTMLGDKIAFLVCHFPTSPHHELQPMGLRFIEAFYMQYVHTRYMNASPAIVEAMRVHIFDLFKARMESPMDTTITPTMMDYLEGVLDPVLFPHNVKALFQEVLLLLLLLLPPSAYVLLMGLWHRATSCKSSSRCKCNPSSKAPIDVARNTLTHTWAACCASSVSSSCIKWRTSISSLCWNARI